MFLAAKTFSVHRRVRNHYTKRILNLTLNRKNFLRRENETLDAQKPRQIRRAKDTKFKTPPRWRRSQLAAGCFDRMRFLPQERVSESTGRRRAQGLRRKTRRSGRSGQGDACEEHAQGNGETTCACREAIRLPEAKGRAAKRWLQGANLPR